MFMVNKSLTVFLDNKLYRYRL